MSGNAMSPIARAEQQLKELEAAVAAQPPQPPAAPVAPAASAPPAVAAEPPAPADPPASQQKDDYYQRWKTLDGMLKKKDDQINQLLTQNQELLAKVSALVTTRQEPPAAPQPKQDMQAVLDELAQQYGPDTVGVVDRITDLKTAELARRVEQLNAQLESMTGLADSVNSLGQRQAKSDLEIFQGKLTERVSDWRKIIAMPEWERWLDENGDDLSGRSYAEVFDEANSNWSLTPLVTLFTKFKAGVAAPPQADPREGMVTPGSHAVGTAGSAAPQARIWTVQEVEKAYDNARRGVYTPEQWQAIDYEITVALAENRIR